MRLFCGISFIYTRLSFYVVIGLDAILGYGQSA